MSFTSDIPSEVSNFFDGISYYDVVSGPSGSSQSSVVTAATMAARLSPTESDRRSVTPAVLLQHQTPLHVRQARLRHLQQTQRGGGRISETAAARGPPFTVPSFDRRSSPGSGVKRATTAVHVRSVQPRAILPASSVPRVSGERPDCSVPLDQQCVRQHSQFQRSPQHRNTQPLVFSQRAAPLVVLPTISQSTTASVCHPAASQTRGGISGSGGDVILPSGSVRSAAVSGGGGVLSLARAVAAGGGGTNDSGPHEDMEVDTPLTFTGDCLPVAPDQAGITDSASIESRSDPSDAGQIVPDDADANAASRDGTRRVRSLQQYRKMRLRNFVISETANPSSATPVSACFMSDKLALCGRCGALSPDLTQCQRCRRQLPPDTPTMERLPPSPPIGTVFRSDFSAPNNKKMSLVMSNQRHVISTRSRKKFIEEPECLTISSSDEEEPPSASIGPTAAADKAADALKSGSAKCSTIPSDHRRYNNVLSGNSAVQTDPGNCGECVGGRSEIASCSVAEDRSKTAQHTTTADTGDCNSDGETRSQLAAASGGWLAGEYVSLPARTVRVGSHRCIPVEPVLFSRCTFSCRLPTAASSAQLVTLSLQLSDDVRLVQLHLGQQLAAVFLYVTSESGRQLRQLLQMSDAPAAVDRGSVSAAAPYFDPDGTSEQCKRITVIFEEPMFDESRQALMAVLRNLGENRLQLISAEQTNHILLISSPLPLSLCLQRTGAFNSDSANTTLFQYPLAPCRGAIPVTVADYVCLEEEQFLNDVIIDFYLKYLVNSRLAPEDRRRTHVFSSFFYQRLTTRAASRTSCRVSAAAGSSSAAASDTKLSAAEKRHARVKSWTKNVDIFDKDFLFVPINEHSHWFLAIVCFAGMLSCRRLCDNEPCVRPEIQTSARTSRRPPKDTGGACATVMTQPSVVSRVSVSTAVTVVTGGMNIVPIKIGNTLVMPVPSTSSSPANTIISPTASSLQPALVDESDRDEADSDEEDVDGDDDDSSCSRLAEVPSFPTTTAADCADNDDDEQECPLLSNIPAIDYSRCPRTAVKQPCILILDSLAGPSRSRVVATLRDYLRVEYAVRRGAKATPITDTTSSTAAAAAKLFDRSSLRGCCVRVLQQDNFTDCGLYVLQYAESFFQSPLMDFRTPLSSMTSWFPSWRVTRKRQHLARLIAHLADKQMPGRSRLLPTLCFSQSTTATTTPPTSAMSQSPSAKQSVVDKDVGAESGGRTAPPQCQLSAGSGLAALANSYGSSPSLNSEDDNSDEEYLPPAPSVAPESPDIARAKAEAASLANIPASVSVRWSDDNPPSTSHSPTAKAVQLPATAARLLLQQRRQQAAVGSSDPANVGKRSSVSATPSGKILRRI